MAEYLHLFSSASTFNDAYANDYKEPWVSYTVENSGVAYNKKSVPPTPHDYSQDYLTFVVLDNDTYIESNVDLIEFSTDGGLTWASDETGNLSAGDKVLARGNVKSGLESTPLVNITGFVSLEGNIMSIYDSTGFRTRTSFDGQNDNLEWIFYGLTGLTSAENLILPLTTLTTSCYYGMFYGCTNLTSVPALPATTLRSFCYYSMFYGCTSLISAPELPATTLADYCYDNMFYGCTSLTTAPELPATTLADYCYNSMFYGCTSLNYIKCLATDISASDYTWEWVNGVSATGTFIKDSLTSWPTGTNGIPSGWTVQNA